MRAIIRCTCGGISTYVENSCKVLGINRNGVEEIKGKEAIRKLAAKYPNTQVGKHLQAVAKKSGRYAYYMEANEEGGITAFYNLVTGKKVY